MATHAQYYLTCSKCGIQFIAEDGESNGETEEEIRDLAVDEGWLCYQGMSEDYDYCRECKTQQPTRI